MNNYLLLGYEIFVSLGLSFWVTYVLKKILYPVLEETCLSTHQSNFWVQFTRLMVYLAPLLLVIFSSVVGEARAPDALLIMKNSLFKGLLGVFVAVLVVGYLIWKNVMRRVDEPQSEVSSERPDYADSVVKSPVLDPYLTPGRP